MRTSHLFLGTVIITGIALASCTPQKAPPAETPGAMTAPEHILVAQSDIVWNNAPPVLPKGAKIAVIEGDPAKAGPFTLRIQLPGNSTIAPHWHPADEHVTVISGDFALGMGDTFDASKLESLGDSGFAMMKTGTRHFARSENGAVVQLHGIGPWGLTYVNPADDPRNAQ